LSALVPAQIPHSDHFWERWVMRGNRAPKPTKMIRRQPRMKKTYEAATSHAVGLLHSSFTVGRKASQQSVLGRTRDTPVNIPLSGTTYQPLQVRRRLRRPAPASPLAPRMQPIPPVALQAPSPAVEEHLGDPCSKQPALTLPSPCARHMTRGRIPGMLSSRAHPPKMLPLAGLSLWER